MDQLEDRRIHEGLGMAGLRAQATAAGLLQLSMELVRAGVLDLAALERIKDAITCELVIQRPRSASKMEFERSIRHQLDSLFRESDGSDKAFLREQH